MDHCGVHVGQWAYVSCHAAYVALQQGWHGRYVSSISQLGRLCLRA
jgi:hypothetical protein